MSDLINTVSEITGLIKQTLEENFSEINVLGEISNFKAHVSGHWYFTLKDSGAQISCTMWRGVNSYVFFTPQDGMKVIVSGKISVYAPRGSYQIDVRSMKPAGVGELQAAFEKLKAKLSAEGLFDSEYKKEIPTFPKRIGIVTAIDGAAFQDMKSIASRRFPLAELVIASCKVQGDGASAEIANSIKLLNQQSNIDVIIVGRGGGSLEDLWAFNEEVVARAIFDSEIPVISAVGHEIDFTIADFVADLRAATPSAAMELATPNKDEILEFIRNSISNSGVNIQNRMNRYSTDIKSILGSYGFRLLQDKINSKFQLLDNTTYRLVHLTEARIVAEKQRLDLLENRIKAYSVDDVLKRGFVIVKQNEKIVSRKNEFIESKELSLKFFDGEIKVNG